MKLKLLVSALLIFSVSGCANSVVPKEETVTVYKISDRLDDMMREVGAPAVHNMSNSVEYQDIYSYAEDDNLMDISYVKNQKLFNKAYQYCSTVSDSFWANIGDTSTDIGSKRMHEYYDIVNNCTKLSYMYSDILENNDKALKSGKKVIEQTIDADDNARSLYIKALQAMRDLSKPISNEKMYGGVQSLEETVRPSNVEQTPVPIPSKVKAYSHPSFNAYKEELYQWGKANGMEIDLRNQQKYIDYGLCQIRVEKAHKEFVITDEQAIAAAFQCMNK